MSLIRVIMICLVISTNIGCATQAKFKAKMETWIGADADRLIRQNGPPDQSATLSNGDKVLQYTSDSGVISHSSIMPATGVMITSHRRDWCVIRFDVRGSDNTIREVGFEGNDCVSK
jgi:hypothetical protein